MTTDHGPFLIDENTAMRGALVVKDDIEYLSVSLESFDLMDSITLMFTRDGFRNFAEATQATLLMTTLLAREENV